MNAANANLLNLRSLLAGNYDNIYIFTHLRPDGDAIGSSLALANALKTGCKTVEVFCPDVIPPRYYFLPGVDNFQVSFTAREGKSLAFILDCSDLRRLNNMGEKVLQLDRVVNIDHHITNEKFGDVNLIDASAASTGEIIYQILKDDYELNYDISLCLYVAISSDTGSFKYENTTPQTMEIAARLLEKGINPFYVSQKIFDEYPASTIFLLRDALGSLRFDETGKIAWMVVDDAMLKKHGAESSDLDGFINYVKNIESVEVGIFFYQTDKGETKVGFRSKTVDIASVAYSLGGGGHPRAAGCSLRGEPQEVIAKVVQSVAQLFCKG
jgi:phosphoesterase RecJ-like protein